MSSGGRKRALAAACVALLLGLRPAGAGAQPSDALVPSAASTGDGSRFRGMIARVFSLEDVVVDGGQTDELGNVHGYRFQVFDEKNRYARVLGPFEGHDDFFLLRGRGRDYLVYIQYDCQPACEQHMTVYRFDADDGAAPVRVSLTKFLDLARFSSDRRKFLDLCLDSGGSFDMEKSSRAKSRVALPGCPYALSFSKRGRPSAVLFVIADENGSGFALSDGKTTVTPVAQLRWDGAELIGVEPESSEPLFLSGDRMDAFF